MEQDEDDTVDGDEDAENANNRTILEDLAKEIAADSKSKSPNSPNQNQGEIPEKGNTAR